MTSSEDSSSLPTSELIPSSNISANPDHQDLIQSPLLRLPSEIRTPIYPHLSAPSLLNLRSTCKTLHAEIDTSLGLPIDLDERLFSSRDPLLTLPPSASSLRIWGWNRTHDYISRLLYHSRLLSSTTFSGPTEVSTVKKVLSRCANLNSISFTNHTQFDTRFLIPFKPRNVKTLRIGVKEIRRAGPASPPTPWVLYTDLLTNLAFPCLKTLHIEYTLLPEESSSYLEMFRTVLSYLLGHKSVSDLTLRYHKSAVSSAYRPSDKVATSSRVSLTRKTSPLGHLLTEKEEAQLTSFPNFRRLVISTDSELGAIWALVLQSQRHLVVLDFLNSGLDWPFFSKVVKNNRTTLEIVRLRNLLRDEGPLTEPQNRVDLAAFEFESCTNLRELFLSRWENCTREITSKSRVHQKPLPGHLPYLDRPGSRFPELIRFRAIPRILQRLHLQGFTVKTEDLALLPERMTNLRVLELCLLGYNPGRSCLEPGSVARPEIGSGDWNAGPGDEKLPENVTKSAKDLSLDGFGVTGDILGSLIGKLRSLETLFVEEFTNEKTDLVAGDPEFVKALRKVNVIPGFCLQKTLGYYGVLVTKRDGPIGRGDGDSVTGSGWTPPEILDSWEGRLNQYRAQYRGMMMAKKNGSRPGSVQKLAPERRL